MEDMYRIMNRIGEIKKRFGVMRHNNSGAGKDPAGMDYQSLQNEALTEKALKKTGKRGTSTGGPFIPAENIRGEVEQLKKLLNRYNGDYTRALSAYIAGMKSADRTGGVVEIKETGDYVDTVINAYLKNR